MSAHHGTRVKFLTLENLRGESGQKIETNKEDWLLTEAHLVV